MAINKQQLREMIVTVLRYLEPEIPFSEEAVELLMLTAAVESNLGDFVKQYGGGPGRGIFQVEKLTEYALLIWLERVPKLEEKVLKLKGEHPAQIDPAMYDLDYQIALARVFYRRVPEALPEITMVRDRIGYNSIWAMAEYYKRYWNTHKGKSTVQGTIEKYYKYVAPRRKGEE